MMKTKTLPKSRGFATIVNGKLTVYVGATQREMTMKFFNTKVVKVKFDYLTAEQTTKMVADYAAGVAVETIAESMGKTVRSVVAKLSREKVYVAKTYVSKTGAPVVKKDAHADAIGAILKMTESEIESLTKANKTALEKIFSALANSKPI